MPHLHKFRPDGYPNSDAKSRMQDRTAIAAMAQSGIAAQQLSHTHSRTRQRFLGFLLVIGQGKFRIRTPRDLHLVAFHMQSTGEQRRSSTAFKQWERMRGLHRAWIVEYPNPRGAFCGRRRCEYGSGCVCLICRPYCLPSTYSSRLVRLDTNVEQE